MKFQVTLKRDEGGIWVAKCPTIPGCVSQGKTKEEALGNIQEAIKLCLEVRAERGLPLTIETQEMKKRSEAEIENPYQSPASTVSRTQGHGGLLKGLVVIVVATASTLVVGTVLGTVLIRIVLGSGPHFVPAVVLSWLRLVVLLAGRLVPDLLCGLLLGRYLERARAWVVFAFLCLAYIAVGVLGYHLGIRREWERAVGTLVVGIQMSLEALAPLAIIAIGILLSRRERPWRPG